MPWKVFKKDNEYCVHKLNSDGSKGELVKCHPDKDSARDHQEALYVSENKEKGYKEQAEKDNREKHMEKVPYIPFGLTTFEELEKHREASDVEDDVKDLYADFKGLSDNILYSDELSASQIATKLNELSDDFGQRVIQVDGADGDSEDKDKDTEDSSDEKEKEQQTDDYKADASTLDALVNKVSNAVIKKVKSWFDRDEPLPESSDRFMVWKDTDADQYRWLARYSNNFRDDDIPPEIISKESHMRFVDKVDKGEYPYPELWLWHTKEWKYGEATWVAYDDAGFALASGTIDKGKEDIALMVSKQDNVLVSHGMPNDSLKYDPNEKNVIVEHQTAELGPLPAKFAASKMTGFVLLKDNISKEANVAISKKKRRELENEWSVPSEILDSLESLNANDASKAVEAGLESKEKNEDEPLEADDEEMDNKDKEENKEQSSDKDVKEDGDKDNAPDEYKEAPTRQEVAEAVSSILVPVIEKVDGITEAINAINKDIESLQKSDEEKISNVAKDTPTASLQSMLLNSVIGKDETSIDGRKKLAKSKPKETEADARATGVPFIDKMLSEE